jgi:hypothetical protein
MFTSVAQKDKTEPMNYSNIEAIQQCEVCGASAQQSTAQQSDFNCLFCGFKKLASSETDQPNDELIFAPDVNEFFKNKYSALNKGETFELSVPVSRFYKTPTPHPNQINFFKSKNIMFLIEQHGFQMVKRKSRFSTQLSLTIRRV